MSTHEKYNILQQQQSTPILMLATPYNVEL